MGRLGQLGLLSGARKLAKENAGKVHQGVDKAADAVKGRVGSRHEDKVEKGASWAKKLLTGSDRARPAEG